MIVDSARLASLYWQFKIVTRKVVAPSRNGMSFVEGTAPPGDSILANGYVRISTWHVSMGRVPWALAGVSPAGERVADPRTSFGKEKNAFTSRHNPSAAPEAKTPTKVPM